MNFTNENTGSQAAEVYLYGLSEDGGKTFSAFKDMRHGDDTSYWAFGVKVEGVEWVPVCSLPEALAAPKRTEALKVAREDFLRVSRLSDLSNVPEYCDDAIARVDEALAACGPDYTPAPDPRDEEIRRLREALTKAETALAIAGSYSAPDQRRILEAKERARAALRGDK